MVGELDEEKRVKFTLEQNMSVKNETKEQNQSKNSEKSSDPIKNNSNIEIQDLEDMKIQDFECIEIQDYEETNVVMETQLQQKTEITLRAVEHKPQLDKTNMESSNCSESSTNSKATMKITTRGKITLPPFKITPPHPTTVTIDEDHLDVSRYSPIQVSNVLADNKQSKSSPGAIVSTTEDREVPGLNMFNPTTYLSEGENTTGYQPQLTGVNAADINQVMKNHQQFQSIKEGNTSRAMTLSGSMNSSRPSMDITTNESDSPMNARLEPKTEKVKIRVMRMSTKPTKENRMQQNLRIILSPLTRAFASKDDLTEEVLAKLRYNIKGLRDDHLVFNSDMNIKEGRLVDMWTMMKQFLSQDISWWEQLIEVAKHEAGISAMPYPSEDVLSDQDIIEDWVREMWNSSTDQSLTRKLLQISQTESLKDSSNTVDYFEHIYDQIKSSLGNDTSITLSATMEESQNPRTTKVNFSHLLTSLRIIQERSQKNDIWDQITPTEMNEIIFPRHFRSRNPWTRSMLIGFMPLKKKLPDKTKNMGPENTLLLHPLMRWRSGLPAAASSVSARQTTSTALENSDKNDGSNPDEISQKSRNAIHLSLQETADTAAESTKEQLRSHNKKKTERDSIWQECNKKKCQFPIQIRRQEGNEPLYITNQWSYEHRTSQDYTFPDDLLIPTTGIESTDLDRQINFTTTTVHQAKSEQTKQRSTDSSDHRRSEEDTEEINKAMTPLDGNKPQDHILNEKEELVKTPSPAHLCISKGALKNPESTIKSAKSEFLPQPSTELQQDNPRNSCASVYAITTSDQSEEDNSSERTTQRRKQDYNHTGKPITSKVMTILMEEFMEQQEKMVTRKEESQENGKSCDSINYTNSNEDEQDGHREQSIASTGYCTIETNNSEKSTVNVNMVKAQDNSSSKRKIGTEMSSAALPARHIQQEGAVSKTNSQDYVNPLLSEEHNVVLQCVNPLLSEEHNIILQYFRLRILRIEEQGICTDPKQVRLLKRYLNRVIPWINLTKMREDVAILKKDFDILVKFAVERKCSTPGCMQPVRCGVNRISKSSLGEFLYSAWECHTPDSCYSILRNPYNTVLMSKQSDDLDRKDINKIESDRGRGCSKPNCPSRAACFTIKNDQRRSGEKSYEFSPCIRKLSKEDVRGFKEYYQKEHKPWAGSISQPEGKNIENRPRVQAEKSKLEQSQRCEKPKLNQIEQLNLGPTHGAGQSGATNVPSSKTSPRMSTPAIGEEELTFYDLRTNSFTTFWIKKTEKLMSNINKLKTSKDKQMLTQKILEEITSTPRQHGEDPGYKIKNLGELQYESIIWEGEAAQIAFTTESGEGNIRRAAFILLDKKDSQITEYQKVTNQKEKSTIDFTKNKRSVTPHDHTKRSQEGHQPNHDLETRYKSPVLKEQPIKHQAITSQAICKPQPRFVTPSEEMRTKPTRMDRESSTWQFLTIIKDARHLYTEFGESKQRRAIRLQQAEDWAEKVPKQAFKTSNYPIQILLPFITGKFNIHTIAFFNIYFNVSRTLLLVPTPAVWFNSQQTEDLEKQMETKFKLDSVRMECSRAGCTSRTRCYGGRAIKERGGSSYDLWQCYKPRKGNATARTNLAQSYNEIKPVPARNIKTMPKQKIKVSPSLTSRQENHLNINTNPRKRIYTKGEEGTIEDQAFNININVSYAQQPHNPNGNKGKLHLEP